MKNTQYTLLDTRQKIRTPEDLFAIVQRRQAAGERAVFTNGCFDLLHLGHVRYLQDARSLGDFLVLGLNSDESTRHLKGPGRPLVPAMERAEILASLTSLDYITIFSEPTANALVELLQPAIYVKGGDYANTHGALEALGAQGASGAPEPDYSRLPEAAIVQAYGGQVRLIPYLPHHSTSELIAKVKALP